MNKNNLKEVITHGTPSFPIAIYNNSFEEQYDILAPLHYHKEFELLIATKGSLSVQIEDNNYILKEGEGLFINSGLLHMISSYVNEPHSFIATVFDYSILCSEHESAFTKYIHPLINNTLSFPIYLSAEICEKIYSIFNKYDAASFGFELYVKHTLIEIFYNFFQSSEPTTIPVQTSKSLIIKKVLDYVEENFSENISLKDMADHIHISKEYLCRIFNTMSDSSPVDYLNRYRIKQSTNLLLHSGRSISDISLSCGFNNSSYYNKLFLRYMGKTPSEYRKSNTSHM